jgi:hypothetical protein
MLELICTLTLSVAKWRNSRAKRAGMRSPRRTTRITTNLSRSFGFAALAIWLFTAPNAAAQADAWTRSDDSIADRIECANGFPEATLQTFAYKESGYDAEAWRFEIAYSDKTGSYYQKIRARAYAFCKARGFNGRPSVDTEIAQRGISWGMFQMLGDNLRETGCKRLFMSGLTRAESFEFFALFFDKIWQKRKNFHLACVEYNGGAAAVTRGRAFYAKAKYNPWEYADRMVQIRKEFSR